MELALLLAAILLAPVVVESYLASLHLEGVDVTTIGAAPAFKGRDGIARIDHGLETAESALRGRFMVGDARGADCAP